MIKTRQKSLGFIALMAVPLARMAGATIGSSEPTAWRLAHPDAQILAGVDFRKLAETADGREIRNQFEAAMGAPMLQQAERLLLSSVVEASGKRSDLLILSGSFSLLGLRKMATGEGARTTPYKGLEIAAPAGAVAGDPHLAWLSGPGGATTVLIGTRPAIQAAAERSKGYAGSLASINPLFARGRDLNSKYPIWVTCETVPRGFGPKALDRFAADGDGLDGFDLAIHVERTAALNLWLWTASESTAEAVLKLLQNAVGGPDHFVISAWLPQLKGSIEESTLVLSAPIAAGRVAERIGPILAAFALPVDEKVSAAPKASINRSAAISAPPPKKLFVRLEGMDDGVKEIPYNR